MNMDKQGLEFGKLLELFKQTQATMQTQAARACLLHTEIGQSCNLEFLTFAEEG